jgi:hypothetical protein
MITSSDSSWVAHPDADFHDLGVDLYADRLGGNAMREHIRHLIDQAVLMVHITLSRSGALS